MPSVDDHGFVAPDLVLCWCGPEEAATVHTLTQSAFKGQELLEPPSSATRETLEVVRSDLEAGRGVVGWLGDRPVAAARVLFFDDHLHVRRIAVHPPYRRRGIASSLISWLHEQAAQRGYRYVALGTRKALHLNRVLYERLGYHQVRDNGFWVEMHHVLGPQEADAVSG